MESGWANSSDQAIASRSTASGLLEITSGVITGERRIPLALMSLGLAIEQRLLAVILPP